MLLWWYVGSAAVMVISIASIMEDKPKKAIISLLAGIAIMIFFAYTAGPNSPYYGVV